MAELTDRDLEDVEAIAYIVRRITADLANLQVQRSDMLDGFAAGRYALKVTAEHGVQLVMYQAPAEPAPESPAGYL